LHYFCLFAIKKLIDELFCLDSAAVSLRAWQVRTYCATLCALLLIESMLQLFCVFAFFVCVQAIDVSKDQDTDQRTDIILLLIDSIFLCNFF